jgi:hypothetical protein
MEQPSNKQKITEVLKTLLKIELTRDQLSLIFGILEGHHITCKSLATLLSVNERTVRKLAADEIVKKDDRGNYDLVGSVNGYINYLRGLAKTGDPTLQDYKKSLLKTQDEMAKIELQKIRGSLVEKDEVKKEAFNTARILRDNILNIPARVTPLITSVSDDHAVQTILEQELQKVLEDLTK